MGVASLLYDEQILFDILFTFLGGIGRNALGNLFPPYTIKT
ncbi:hypothetical protein PGJ_00011230 [Porphyromonas gingivalis AJW4]|uniref:Uncharacterized protein n=1 Tax=Porphyromonas gingivalis F0570 TaxID=1227271 RepID=A0A0E2LQH7_PORGN|nr:hypothetical protein PGA7_00012420 [Porphyromonas gingivalis]ALA93727.1 hypothetical protein PGJ_00011230 [Porphyromonas gingivalis AJW4]ALJ25179.1 hypothetical protein PGF_00007230 [Porphyromonas gingivalis 381]ALO29923.1 hypothetical protein PGS_00012140 [Porphyromonas gingivalis A7A1-28]EOA10808.1 hypothetical protein A343_2015 [Porphyromonas gingivalis JCVI SC001]ERJ66105.1 hypothetical protein HMPREF1555_01220 [Porphyromonas gingivalis F0570]ERJ67139.1 hypothetical protein HMPREF1553_